MSSSNSKSPRFLLQVFMTGSLVVLLICLCGAALFFSSTFLKKERQRASLSKDQLSHFFDFQYRAITEEMYTENYGAVSSRVADIAKQFGHAAYEVTLANQNGSCVFKGDATLDTRSCESPEPMKVWISRFKVGSDPKPILDFDEKTRRYVYTVPLYVGPVFKGYLYATLTDPYEFSRGDPLTVATKLFLPTLMVILSLWGMWLILSRQFILQPYFAALISLERKQALAELASTVAHDIRQPLATITSVVRSIKALNLKQRHLIDSAAARITNLADRLLEKYTDKKEDQFTFVAVTVNSIVAEKIAILGEKSNTEIRTQINPDAMFLGVGISGGDLASLMSNILKNSMDATNEKNRGLIEIYAKKEEEKICITIKDNGCGMSPEVLHKVRTLGGTHGKPGGLGIGIQSAKSILVRANGTFSIDSSQGAGTTIILQIPIAPIPSWCAHEIILAADERVIVLDDDESVHIQWKDRLEGFEVTYLNDPEEFDLARFPKGDSYYIFDYDISGSVVKGIDLIRTHGLGKKAILVTSYFDSPHIQKEIEKMGASLLPKFMIPHVKITKIVEPPVSIAEGSEKPNQPDLVLIDDDPDSHDLWQYDAEQYDKKILTLSAPSELKTNNVEFDTPVYVDVNFLNGLSGLDIVADLHSQGFKSLFLTTGEMLNQATIPSYIRGVIGKEFPREV